MCAQVTAVITLPRMCPSALLPHVLLNSSSSLARPTTKTVKSTVAENLTHAHRGSRFSLEAVTGQSGKVTARSCGCCSGGIRYGCTCTLLPKEKLGHLIISQSLSISSDALTAIYRELSDFPAAKGGPVACQWLQRDRTGEELLSLHLQTDHR